eukprot:gene5724-6619_t
MKRMHLIFLVMSIMWLAGIVIYLIASDSSFSQNLTLPTKSVFHCEHIDVVYTWVNGSDPVHMESRTKRSGHSRYSAPGNNRYRDLMGLKYSLRSLKKNASWIRKVFVVSDSQYPDWFDTSNEEIKFIFHKDYFPNQDDIPTFNSNGIESNFYNLPDEVSDCFIYFNDDIFVGSPITMRDFWDATYGQAVYQSSWTAPQPIEKQSNIWHAHYASHGANFFNKNVLKMIQETLGEELNATTSHPFRTSKDLQIPFLYLQFVSRFHATYQPKAINHYALITDDLQNMKKEFGRILDRRPKTVCLNDGMSSDDANQEVIVELKNMFETFFPEKPSWEL